MESWEKDFRSPQFQHTLPSMSLEAVTLTHEILCTLMQEVKVIVMTNYRRAVSAIYLFRWTEMHRDFAGLMQHLCGCLGIQYDPSLRQATFMGNPGWDSRESKEERLVIRATFKKSRGRC